MSAAPQFPEWMLLAANGEATRRGADVAGSLVTVSEESPPPHLVWRVHYGPRDYVNVRGGDPSVPIDDRTGGIDRVIRGQRWSTMELVTRRVPSLGRQSHADDLSRNGPLSGRFPALARSP